MIKGLQLSDEHNVAIPANWPNNEIVGNNVIVPPASSEQEAESRRRAQERGEIECLDWWFCHKKVKE
jgi:peroxiredoxin (alkyl hydroperoxide reductase subunit C)